MKLNTDIFNVEAKVKKLAPKLRWNAKYAGI